MTTTIPVRLGDRSYDVVVGSGVRASLAGIIARLGARRAAVVSARPKAWVPATGVETLLIPARDGEYGKRLCTVEDLCGEFVRFGLTRTDVVVSIGGGTTTDVVGLAAGLYHRGVAVIHLPTSLLAQVDASVGGKTAVNLADGKNMIGTFWQPSAVLCDTDYLATLSPRELRNGFGEIARGHFIGSGDLRDRPLAEQIAASVTLKARIVEVDERDAGKRHLLNYGHTLGHALELATGFALRHGEAVAIGTVYAGLLACALGRIDESRVDEHLAVVRHYGLPTALPTDVDPVALVRQMHRDKKAFRGLGFVLDGPAGAELVSDVPEDVVVRVLGEMPRAPLEELIQVKQTEAAPA
ncbi:MAG TPA: 3-dehydroquinate synthase family protein [Pseudonocardiaceae bacterium]